jgi:molybdopterin-guanine dinucleotide biosynthesis protein A
MDGVGVDLGWGAVVLAGGRARRLGGVDKPGLTVGGRTLLDGVLAACHGAVPIVVVGPPRPTAVEVRWEREDPPHAGPLAALAAGLRAVPTPIVAVLAADLPNLRPHTVDRLRAAISAGTADTAVGADEPDGAVLVDEHGRPQWLCGVWRTAPLRAALAEAGELADRPLHAVLTTLTVTAVPALPGEASDVDTPDDLRAHSRHTARPVT